jgi:hypothetical protein
MLFKGENKKLKEGDRKPELRRLVCCQSEFIEDQKKNLSG